MRSRILVATFLAVSIANFATAAENPKAKAAQRQAEMEAMMKAATPGDAHKKLGAIVGTFNTEAKMWMDPGAPPSTGIGVSENTWALDGRFVQQQFTGTFMGMPYHGIGYTGYDNVKKKYTDAWMDNMSTSMMVSTGSAAADGKSITFTSTMDDPMTGKSSEVRETVTIADDDHHMLELWGAGSDGKPFKMMEITYTRKK